MTTTPTDAQVEAAALAIARDIYFPSDDLRRVRQFPADVRATVRHYARLALTAAFAVKEPKQQE